MEDEDLKDLIANKWFDKFQSGLKSRFSANRMEYSYAYACTDSVNSVIVDLKKGDIVTKVELNEDGILSFKYSNENKRNTYRFKECSSDDFHTMLAHAFIYLRDGNFEYHREWFDKLKRL